MKSLKISLFLLGMIVAFVACQQSFEDDLDLAQNEADITAMQMRGLSMNIEPEYMPLNVIPDWAREKMTEEEYELWEVMSTKFKIDYSFLLDSQYEFKRENIKKSIYDIAQNLNEHESNVNFRICYFKKNNIETLSDPEAFPDNTVQMDIYRDGEVYMQFTTIYDILYLSSGKVNIRLINPNFTWGPSSRKVAFKGSTRYRVAADNVLYISCVGTLEYDTNTVSINQNLNANLIIP